ncbi:DUF262 domain-containing protein [Pedobacter changchengzhani]|uniref:DUF262 domain-containing protein n=1 Tax=Pedobacter changchengzhani TaxID=2529274 RepID=A0A4R5MNJ0_9SPHI|nr:DUF262 domain-containing protein [Pedobacter changchengzhani]TDG37342.1 DUF262 domain-containing protein [Pedobacter changchengzhani]
MESTNLDNEIVESNKEIIEDMSIVLSENIKTYSRDWTVETIYNQIKQGNIELNPKFQRRNAWTDEKRSRLIESLILKLPVPSIVLAESHTEKNKFVVLDGKQRLLTIAGFIDHEKYKYWDKPILRDLRLKPSLNGMTVELLSQEVNNDNNRAFQNSDIRCTVVFNQSTDDILYEIFYRLNSGAVPLSMQELRQSLRKGDFSDFLMESTESIGPLHKVLGIDQPDKRLIDAEILLKYISNRYSLIDYSGNLKRFLDDNLVKLNKNWESKSSYIKELLTQFDVGIVRLVNIIGNENVGRYSGESRFNRNVFDVQIFYFSQLLDVDINSVNNSKYIEGFKELSKSNSEFRKSLTSSTNTKKNFTTRFECFRTLINDSYDKDFPQILVPESNE